MLLSYTDTLDTFTLYTYSCKMILLLEQKLQKLLLSE